MLPFASMAGGTGWQVPALVLMPWFDHLVGVVTTRFLTFIVKRCLLALLALFLGVSLKSHSLQLAFSAWSSRQDAMGFKGQNA